MNYEKQAAEGGAQPPKRIVFFLRPPHTFTGPDDDFCAPPGVEKLDWEVELAIVFGETARRIASGANPLDYVMGFTAANEL